MFLGRRRATLRLRDFLNEQRLYYVFFSLLYFSLPLSISLSFALSLHVTENSSPPTSETTSPHRVPIFLAASRALSYHPRSNFVNDLA